MNSTSPRNRFVQGLQVPKNKVPNNQNNTNRQVSRYPSPNIPNQQNNYNMPKRNVANRPPVISRKKYQGNIKHKIETFLIIAALIGSGVGIHTIHTRHENQQLARDLQSEIEVMTRQELKDHLDDLDMTFDGTNFNISYECSRPELYNVLVNTDLDELLNAYLANPTKDAKNELLKNLEGREEELAQFNMDLIEASFADSENTSINNIDIKAIFKHYNAENGDRIVNGESTYMGHTLYIHTTKANVEARAGITSGDLTQIPPEIFRLISDARFQLIAPNSSYFENPIKDTKRSALDISIQTYKEIKEIINGGNFAIGNDGKVTIVEIAKSQSQINEKDNELEP